MNKIDFFIKSSQYSQNLISWLALNNIMFYYSSPVNYQIQAWDLIWVAEIHISVADAGPVLLQNMVYASISLTLKRERQLKFL